MEGPCGVGFADVFWAATDPSGGVEGQTLLSAQKRRHARKFPSAVSRILSMYFQFISFLLIHIKRRRSSSVSRLRTVVLQWTIPVIGSGLSPGQTNLFARAQKIGIERALN